MRTTGLILLALGIALLAGSMFYAWLLWVALLPIIGGLILLRPRKA